MVWGFNTHKRDLKTWICKHTFEWGRCFHRRGGFTVATLPIDLLRQQDSSGFSRHLDQMDNRFETLVPYIFTFSLTLTPNKLIWRFVCLYVSHQLYYLSDCSVFCAVSVSVFKPQINLFLEAHMNDLQCSSVHCWDVYIAVFGRR